MFKTHSAFLPSYSFSVKTCLMLSFLQHLNFPGGPFPSVFPPKQFMLFWVINKYHKQTPESGFFVYPKQQLISSAFVKEQNFSLDACATSSHYLQCSQRLCRALNIHVNHMFNCKIVGVNPRVPKATWKPYWKNLRCLTRWSEILVQWMQVSFLFRVA